MTTDPIADFLTRIRNASAAGLKVVEIPGSNTKRATSNGKNKGSMHKQCDITLGSH